MTDRSRGLFVTFEGLDGSGKTTQMRLLAERLRGQGRHVLETAEPGGTAIGKGIRQILLDPANQHLSPVAELLLYFAARAQNVDELINPAVEKGQIVFADRYTDSTMAYQGAGRELGEEVVRQLHHVACRGRDPHLTFLFDIDLKTALDRAHSRNREKALEGLHETRMDEQEVAFYERVHNAYEQLVAAEPRRFCRIDGRGTPEEVSARVWNAFCEFQERHVR